MSLADSVFGKPATTTYTTTAGTKPPGYGFANSFFNSLQGLTSNPFPTLAASGGKLDPGLSPTLTDLIQRAQGYAGSTPPSILQGASGVYGRLMSPNLQNPVTRLFGGAPDYTGRLSAGQKVYGGGNAGSMTFPGSQTSPGAGPGGPGMGGGGGMPPGGGPGGMAGLMSMLGGSGGASQPSTQMPPPTPMPGTGSQQPQPGQQQPNFAMLLQLLQSLSQGGGGQQQQQPNGG